MGCGAGSGDHSAKVTPTYQPAKLDVVEDGGYKIARGATRLAEISIQYDSDAKAMQVRGKIEYQGVKDMKWQTLPLDLVGTLDNKGVIKLINPKQDPKNQDVRFGAKATCLSETGTCYSSFVDIYIYAEGVVYHHQVEANQDKPAKKPSTPTEVAPVNPPSTTSQPEIPEAGEINDGIDDTESKAGPYVGSIPEDIQNILDVPPETKPPEPKREIPEDKPEAKKDDVKKVEVKSGDQAIGSPNEGRLQNPMDVLKLEKMHQPTGFHIIRPERWTHFSTSDLASILVQMGQFTKKEVNEQTLYVGDLSKEHGGSLGRHKSHQNGLDADVAFYFNNKSFHGHFASAVAVDKPHPNWMVEEQWKLFKAIIGTQIIDRIFIHEVLKKSLCDLAQAKGELQKGKEVGLAAETLRRLRADKEHNTHFHLRIKCSKNQLRCRQMAEPPAGSGCF